MKRTTQVSLSSCQQCSEMFSSWQQLKIHIALMHQTNGVTKCSQCYKLYRSLDLLQKHFEAVHEGLKYVGGVRNCAHKNKIFIEK